MALKTAQVPKCLDRKLIFAGYEVPDVLAIFLCLSILNFIFGEISVLLVWVPTILLAIVLRLGKRGKPDNYLIHWLRFQVKPGVFSAFPDPSHIVPPPELVHRSIQ